MAPAVLWKSFLRVGYPELIAEPDRDISLWHSSYVQTYFERDVRSLRQVGDLISFIQPVQLGSQCLSRIVFQTCSKESMYG